MCQHAVAANNEEYFYGFDNISHEFFLFKDIEGEDNELVGGIKEVQMLSKRELEIALNCVGL